jgi:hypothetical protein
MGIVAGVEGRHPARQHSGRTLAGWVFTGQENRDGRDTYMYTDGLRKQISEMDVGPLREKMCLVEKFGAPSSRPVIRSRRSACPEWKDRDESGYSTTTN